MHEGLDTGKELGGIVTLGFYLRGGLLPTLNTVASVSSIVPLQQYARCVRVFWRMSPSRASPSNVVVNK